MKRILALVLAVTMLGTACCALAEEALGAPMYATYGDAMDAARKAAGEEGNIVAGSFNGEYAAVITEEDGKYFRHVADYDEKLKEMEEARDALDYEADNFWERWEAANAEVDEYMRTLPIVYSEEFTAEPLVQADLDALVGKTVSELAEAGWESEGSGGGDDGIIYTMRSGVFEYDFTVDADFEAYEKALEDGSDGAFVVTGVKFGGITYAAYEKRFHTDGTVEEEQSFDFIDAMPPEAAAIMEAIGEMAEAAKNGEQIDVDKLIDVIEEQFPDKKDTIEPYREIIKMLVEQYGAEGLEQLFAPAE